MVGGGCRTLAGGDGLRKRGLNNVVRTLERGRPGKEWFAARAVRCIGVGGVARALRFACGGGGLERHGGLGEVLAQPIRNQRAAATRQARGCDR